MDVGPRGFVWYGLRVLADALFGVAFLSVLFHVSGRFPDGLVVAGVGIALGGVLLLAARRTEPPA